jgi:hypothetical protein
MIQKTVKTFRYTRRDWHWRKRRRKDTHTETYLRATWWLLWIIPLYSHDELVGNNL